MVSIRKGDAGTHRNQTKREIDELIKSTEVLAKACGIVLYEDIAKVIDTVAQDMIDDAEDRRLL